MCDDLEAAAVKYEFCRQFFEIAGLTVGISGCGFFFSKAFIFEGKVRHLCIVEILRYKLFCGVRM